MNNFKRILLIALCSILCVCTVPRFSFTSEAVEASTFLMRESLLYLYSYLSSRGYSIAHEYGSSIPSLSELKDMTFDQIGQVYFEIGRKLDAFGAEHDLPDVGEKLLSAIELSLTSGALVLSPTVRDAVDLWLQLSSSNNSIEVGSTTADFSYYSTEPYSYYYNGTRFIQFPSSTVAIFRTSSIISNTGVALFLPEDIEDFTYNALTNTYTYDYSGRTGAIWNTVSTTFNNATYKVYSSSFSSIPNFLYFTQTYDSTTNLPSLSDILSLYLNGQYETVDGPPLVISQITDTFDSDLLTSTNTIASDGTVEGDTTIYLPDQSTLESAIDDYNQGSISYDDFLKILGLNSVASDATVQEKEDALTAVVTPSEDYLWFTGTQWGSDAIEETRKASASTRAEEDSLADSIAKTANGGSAPEDSDNKSRGKGLLALLLIGLGIWNTPIIAGDGSPSGGGTDDDSGDGSDDTSGYLTESIAGMAIAGSLVDDLFNSAGGSNGYGLIYTVGASFVIFSVIIGAANYFGALFHGSDTKQNFKASGKRSTPGKGKSTPGKQKKGG